MNNEISDKLAQRAKEAAETNLSASAALGILHYDGSRYVYANEKQQQGLVAAFGRAAFDKAVDACKLRDASIALAHALTDASVPTENLGVVCRGEFHYSVRQLFPALKPKERAEVKTDLEKKGFAFTGETLSGFSPRP